LERIVAKRASELEKAPLHETCPPPLASRVESGAHEKPVARSALLEIAATEPRQGSLELENAELVERMRTEPADTARLVYARFAPAINRLVWRLLGADPDHNDVVQQVFYRVLRQIGRLREPEKIDSWVQRIAVNTVYELLRRRQVRRLFLKELPTEAHADLVRDVETRDVLLRTKAVVDRLPPKERIVFVLYYVEGRTLAELAEIGGYSIATAKRRVMRANQRFQFLLSKNPELLGLFRRQSEEEP
jgi:RNA polymerase sigma-70 factor (ECF subfamily)